MVDTTTVTNDAQAATDVTAQAATSNAQAATENGTQSQPITDYKTEYEKLNGKHSDLLKEAKSLRERAKALDAIEADKKTAEEQKLKEQGEYKTLLDKAEAEKQELLTKLAARDRADLLAKVAKKHNLPDDLAPRLQGETEAELDADAAKLAKLIPPPTTQARQGVSASPPPSGSAPDARDTSAREVAGARYRARF